MNIKGVKVLLRAIEPEDNSMLYELINDEEVEYMAGGWSLPVSRQDQENWFKNLINEKNCLRCVVDVDGNAIGLVALSNIDFKNGNAEMHIKIASKNFRNKGYGKDSILALSRYAFKELRLKCIYAHINEHNVASQKLFQKCGFFQEGLLRCRLYKRGEYVNVFSFAKIDE